MDWIESRDLFINVACNKEVVSKDVAGPDVKVRTLDWNLKTLVGAYQSVGRTNAAWDEPAKVALTEFARWLNFRG